MVTAVLTARPAPVLRHQRPEDVAASQSNGSACSCRGGKRRVRISAKSDITAGGAGDLCERRGNQAARRPAFGRPDDARSACGDGHLRRRGSQLRARCVVRRRQRAGLAKAAALHPLGQEASRARGMTRSSPFPRPRRAEPSRPGMAGWFRCSGTARRAHPRGDTQSSCGRCRGVRDRQPGFSDCVDGIVGGHQPLTSIPYTGSRAVSGTSRASGNPADPLFRSGAVEEGQRGRRKGRQDLKPRDAGAGDEDSSLGFRDRSAPAPRRDSAASI